MNLDELAKRIREISSDPVAWRLADMLDDWKTDDRTAEDLRDDVERYIGNVWIGKDRDHATIYRLWSAFRKDAIAGIGGMTMNERLWYFSLDERFDACRTGQEKRTVYAKLHAAP